MQNRMDCNSKEYNKIFLSKYPFFNTIPELVSVFSISKEFLIINSSKIIKNLPKNFIIYPKNVDNEIRCNYIIAKAAFPEYFPTNSQSIIQKTFTKKVDPNDVIKMSQKYASVGKLYELIQEREKISFEKKSFENNNSKSFYKLFHPNADRSSKRKEEITNQYNQLSESINEISKNISNDFCYISAINQKEAIEIQKFMDGQLINLNKKSLHKIISPGFIDILLKNNYKIYLSDVDDEQKKAMIEISPLLGWFFSKKILKSNSDEIEVKVKNCIEMAEVLKTLLFSEEKVVLYYHQYPILKQIAEAFESDYMSKCIKCFECNLKDFNNAIKQANMFIEIQEKILNLSTDNLIDTSIFLQTLFETPYFINEVSHQIEVASKIRPKMNQLLQKLCDDIQIHLKNQEFKCKVEKVSFSEIEQIIIDDDLAALQTYINENLKFDMNKSIHCNFFHYDNPTLINLASFYGSVKCFKFLLSNGANADEALLLKYAVAGGNIEIVRMLADSINGKKIGCLSSAAKYHQNEILEWLIEQEIDDSPFLVAASESNNFKAAIFYLYSNFNEMIDTKDYSFADQYYKHNYHVNSALCNKHLNPIEKAVEYNHESYFRFLLNFPDMRVGSFSKTAIQTLNIDFIELILNLENKADEFSLYNDLILKSIETGEIETIKNILSWEKVKNALEKKKSVNTWDKPYYSYSHYNRSTFCEDIIIQSIKTRNIDIIKYIFTFEPIKDAIEKCICNHNSFIENVVIEAVKTGSIEIIEYVLSFELFKKLLNSPINQNESFANEIIKTQDQQIIQKFIRFGNIFRNGHSIDRIIEKLIYQDEIELVLKIVDQNYFKYRSDWSPFPFARTIKSVQFLIDCDSCINYCDSGGETCLSKAIRHKKPDVVKLLLDHGATVTPSDFNHSSLEIKKMINEFKSIV